MLVSEVGMIVLTGLIISALLVGSLAVVNIALEVRRLRVSGAPRPWFVVYRRMSGMLPILFPAGRQDLEDRAAWLSWDLRWTAAGETLARITATVPETGEVRLKLAESITWVGNDPMSPVYLETVRFIPANPGKAAYDRIAVRGTILPALGSGLMATAEIVVYPDQAP
jgi:hypothetical protein